MQTGLYSWMILFIVSMIFSPSKENQKHAPNGHDNPYDPEKETPRYPLNIQDKGERMKPTPPRVPLNRTGKIIFFLRLLEAIFMCDPCSRRG
jgi:hypothetical protein